MFLMILLCFDKVVSTLDVIHIWWQCLLYHQYQEAWLTELDCCLVGPGPDLINVFEVFLPQLLLYPNPTDPLNGEAAALMMRDREHYEQKVKGTRDLHVCISLVLESIQGGGAASVQLWFLTWFMAFNWNYPLKGTEAMNHMVQDWWTSSSAKLHHFFSF
jgi:hypothetical protein